MIAGRLLDGGDNGFPRRGSKKAAEFTGQGMGNRRERKSDKHLAPEPRPIIEVAQIRIDRQRFYPEGGQQRTSLLKQKVERFAAVLAYPPAHIKPVNTDPVGNPFR